jgi:prefoldin subunit 5
VSASEAERSEWLDNRFWERWERLEARHQRIQSEHESVRRGLERLAGDELQQLRETWQRYCAVIAELDCATAELEALRTHAI